MAVFDVDVVIGWLDFEPLSDDGSGVSVQSVTSPVTRHTMPATLVRRVSSSEEHKILSYPSLASLRECCQA